MNSGLKKGFHAFTAVMILVCFISTALAHSGRTDRYGGHHDYNNVSGLGSYHYHHGYRAHLHPGGYCPYTDVFPKSVKLSTEKSVLGIGEKIDISATVSPSNACSTSISWSSSDSSIVRVSNGKITAAGFGTATITATTFNDKTASVRITVQEITADSITLTGVDGPAKTIYINDSMKIGAVLTPQNVDRPQITWASSDQAVATVDESGLIKAVDSGIATITATTTNGLTAQLEITVEEIIAQKIEIKDPGPVSIGQTIQLESVITPANTTYQDVQWQSEDISVAQVSEDGTLTTSGVGEVVIRAIQKDVQAEIKLDVQHIAVTDVSILAAAGFEGSLPAGESTQFTANIAPNDATYPEITWNSSDPTIASIDENGIVTAGSNGTVTITASTQDGITDEVTLQVGSSTNPLVVAGGIGAGGVAASGAIYAVLKKKSTKGKSKGINKTSVACLTLAATMVGGAGFVGINGTAADKYERAIFLTDAGHPSEAAALLQELGNYQNSPDLLAALKESCPIVNFQFADVGDVVVFGSYEQDNNLSNGPEPIDWLVLKNDQDHMLVISQKVLDSRPYSQKPDDKDGLGLYEWLYTSFAPAIFENSNTNPLRELRLLTQDECSEYMKAEDREVEYTPYAKSKNPDTGYQAGYMWWLDGYFRFNGQYKGPVVWENGSYSQTSADVEDRLGVRPVMVLSFAKDEESTFTIYSGMKDGTTTVVDHSGNVIREES